MEFSKSLSNIINSLEENQHSTDWTNMTMNTDDPFEPTPFREGHCHHHVGSDSFIAKNDIPTAPTSIQHIFENVASILRQHDQAKNDHGNNNVNEQQDVFSQLPSFEFSSSSYPAHGEIRNDHNKLQKWSKYHLSTMLMADPSSTNENTHFVKNNSNTKERECIVMDAAASKDNVKSSSFSSNVLSALPNLFTQYNQNTMTPQCQNDPQPSDEFDPSVPPCYTIHQAERWQQRFQELVHFKNEYDHCCVPSHWPQNAPLAQWVKRQRSQYKLKMEGKRSNMTETRQKALEDLGFVWDSHAVFWEERLNELRIFRETHGHCNVPTKYPENQQLAIWAKCQRRQFKLYTQGDRHSNMTMERIRKLSNLGFVFNPRALNKKMKAIM